MRRRAASGGFVLTAAVVAILMLSGLAASTLLLAYNVRRLQDGVTSGRTRAYYHAQAGVVDAQWRIRTNLGGNYDPTDNPATYTLDLDGDGTFEATVDIEAENVATGLRVIHSTGHES